VHFEEVYVVVGVDDADVVAIDVPRVVATIERGFGSDNITHTFVFQHESDSVVRIAAEPIVVVASRIRVGFFVIATR
jgi:hypothetical protein